MPETTARIAAVILSVAFGWASATKVFSFARWNLVLNGYGLPRAITSIAAPLVPVAEIGIALCLLFVSTRAGAAAALAMLAAFCLAILRARSIKGDRLPCGCFGGSESRRYQTMMWRNGFLGMLAAVVLLARDPVEVWIPATPRADEWFPAALVVIGASVALWTVLHVSAALRHKGQP